MLDLFADALDLVRGRGVHLGSVSRVLADRYRDRAAFAMPVDVAGLDFRVTSYADIERAVARLAAAHAGLGTIAGDRVVVAIDNRLDVVLHALALARLQAIPVPVNPRLTAAEFAAVGSAAGITRWVVDEAASAAATAAEVPVVVTGATDGTGIAGWLSANAGAITDPGELDAREVSLMLTTSGTTGTPKAAALTSRGLLAAVGRLSAVPLGRGPREDRDLVLAALPLTHIMGFMVALASMCAGVPLLHRVRFDAAEVLDLIEAERPNAFIGVPTMYADLEAAGAGDRDLTSIQLFVSAADVMPAERARRFQRYGAAASVRGRGLGSAAFADIYGMVELSGAAAIRFYPPSAFARVKVPSIATVVPGVEVRAVDEHGERTGMGQVGELQFRGAGVLREYVGHPGSGADEAGWFASGDHGRVWPGGLFGFAGRDRDRLKVGGFSVFPAEVEEALREHDSVRDVAVVGLPDERLGDRVVALIVPAPGHDLDAAAFLAWAHDAVAGYRRPAAVTAVAAIPRGNNGKVDRRAATELGQTLLGGAADGAVL